MVVDAAPGAGLGVASVQAHPRAGVHAVGRFATSERMRREHRSQRWLAHLPTGERAVQAAPPAAVRWLQAQVGRRWDWPGSQERIAEVEQGIPAVATGGILRRTPGGKSGEGSGIHDVQFAICRRSVVAGQVHPSKSQEIS